MILVDTNILIDVATRDPNWALWSLSQLEAAELVGPLLINDVVYAELSVRYDQIEDLDSFLRQAGIDVAPMPRLALFLSGKVFTQYRKTGGTKTGVMPDFFIGAHAMVAGMPLLTRDPRRYRTYFPALELIAPNLD
jgi:predicted nucleic acid-binding protein